MGEMSKLFNESFNKEQNSYMIKFSAYYFNQGDSRSRVEIIEAPSRMDAIELFETMYPKRMLVSLKSVM